MVGVDPRPGARRLLGRLVAFLLERLYRELAWAYDGVSWLVSLGRWRRWARASLRYLTGERVLEVGCGPGHLLPALAEGGYRGVGCDLSRPMLRQARRRAGRSMALCRARAQALPFATGVFDTILCTFPSGYIADPRTWSEFDRLLAPRGRVVVLYGVYPRGTSLPQRWIRGLLSLGGLRPFGGLGRGLGLDGDVPAGLHLRQVVVEEGDDRLGLLLAERGTGGPNEGWK